MVLKCGPEYLNRFTEKNVEELINTPQSIFVLVKDDAPAGAICGLQRSAEAVSSELVCRLTCAFVLRLNVKHCAKDDRIQ